MASVYAVNLFKLRDGVTAEEFETFSRELDRPTCLALAPVESFEVYFVSDGSGVDVVEVMGVTSWDEWVNERDNAVVMVPVVDRFTELVDTDSVRSHLTTRSPHALDA